MKNIHGDRITENMVVRLRSEVARKKRRESTTVSGWLDVKGGVRLAEKLDGFYCWNVNDLEPVPRRNG